jgi:excisionase family DNA binding protein
MSESISILAASKMLSISDRTVERMIEDGRLSAFKIGRSVRVTRRSIDSYVKHMVLVYAEQNGIINSTQGDSW